MKLQFKYQKFQVDAAKTVADSYQMYDDPCIAIINCGHRQ